VPLHTHTLNGNETYLGAPFPPDDDFTITDNGGAGGNTVTLGNGIDQLTLLDGNNTVTLGNGADRITAGAGNNILTTGTGNSIITVGNGDDTITVGSGSNAIVLGTGLDTVTTAAGNNVVSVSGATVSGDTLKGALTSGDGTTNQLVLTATGTMNPVNVSGFQSYKLANGGPNSLTLSEANFVRLLGGSITVIGGDSGNTIDASALAAAHSVIMIAGAGTDVLTGGAGNDTFQGTETALNLDTITTMNVGDKITFTDATLAGFTFSLSGTTLTYGGTDQINFSNSPVGVLVGSADVLGGVDLTLTSSVIEPQSTLPVAIGGTATISHSFLWSYDTNASVTTAELTYSVLTAPTYGTILDNGVAATSFTQADIDNGLVEYRENGDVASGDGFTFQVTDPAGNHTSIEPYTIAIVNTTAPVIDANVTLSASIGSAAMIWKDSLCTVALGSEPTQLRYTVLTAPAHGVLLVNDARETSFTQAEIDDHRVQYQSNGDAATGDSFTFQATDAAGDQTPITTFNIAVLDGSQGPGADGRTPASSSTAISHTVPLFDLSDISFGADINLGFSANADNTGGALTVSDGMHTANLALLGQYAAAGFATAPDQGGGTLVTYTAAQGGGDAALLSVPLH
jgi:hypothetical protein